MAGRNLYQEYLFKAKSRRKALTTLFDDGNFADVVCESQELVELLLKGLLRRFGIDPPKWHDVSQLLGAHAPLFPAVLRPEFPRMAALSKALRKERELSFYGAEDFIPSENYTAAQASAFLTEVDWLIAVVAAELQQ